MASPRLEKTMSSYAAGWQSVCLFVFLFVVISLADVISFLKTKNLILNKTFLYLKGGFSTSALLTFGLDHWGGGGVWSCAL